MMIKTNVKGVFAQDHTSKSKLFHNIQQAQKCQRKPGSALNCMTAEIQGRLADVTVF